MTSFYTYFHLPPPGRWFNSLSLTKMTDQCLNCITSRLQVETYLRVAAQRLMLGRNSFPRNFPRKSSQRRLKQGKSWSVVYGPILFGYHLDAGTRSATSAKSSYFGLCEPCPSTMVLITKISLWRAGEYNPVLHISELWSPWQGFSTWMAVMWLATRCSWYPMLRKWVGQDMTGGAIFFTFFCFGP